VRGCLGSRTSRQSSQRRPTGIGAQQALCQLQVEINTRPR